jgi:hypothetical protein
MAEAASETRSKRHIPATIAKDKNFARRKLTRLLPGFGIDAPDSIERILQLAEHSAGSEERDHGSDGTGRGLAGTRTILVKYERQSH